MVARFLGSLAGTSGVVGNVLRFRRSIRFAPGVRLNIGKKGLSATIGARGAHVTVGHGQTRTTVGVPGTGVSYTKTTAGQRPPVPESTRRSASTPGGRFIHWLIGSAGALGLAWWTGSF